MSVPITPARLPRPEPRSAGLPAARAVGLAGTPGPLVSEHDVLLLDLDGTVWLGGALLPGIVEVLDAVARAGVRAVYVTNNASRSPEEVAVQLRDGGLSADAADVVTSAQASAALLAGRVPAGSCVLVVGSSALASEAAARGLTPVRFTDLHAGRLRTPGPDGSDRVVAVLQGFTPDTGWRDLAAASHAVAAGAVWVAANVDATLPTDEGLSPGNGSLVAVVSTVTGLSPIVAGKPERPLIDDAVQRSDAHAPLVVGDRLDTDLAAAVGADLPGLLVLTGVSTARDLLAAPVGQRPRYVSADLRGLLVTHPTTRAAAGGHVCGAWRASVVDGVVRVSRTGPAASVRGPGSDSAGSDSHGSDSHGSDSHGSDSHGSGGHSEGTGGSDGLDGLRALCAAVWEAADAPGGRLPDGLDDALRALGPAVAGDGTAPR